MSTRGEATSLRPDQEAAIERARVVGVLDYWATQGRSARHWECIQVGGHHYVNLRFGRGENGERQFVAESADAARFKASVAIIERYV